MRGERECARERVNYGRDEREKERERSCAYVCKTKLEDDSRTHINSLTVLVIKLVGREC